MLEKIKKIILPKEDFEELLPYEQQLKNITLIENKKRIKSNDVFILSYPRSGNTWLRLMICDAILDSHGYNTNKLSSEGDGQKLLFSISPTLTKVNLEDFDNSPCGFRIIKTHNCSDFNHNRFIYIYRSPADALVSYFRFKKKRPIIDSDKQELEDFCFKELRGWRDHLRTVLQKPNGIFINFEDLMKKPDKTLNKVFKFLNLNISETHIKKAIKNQSLENQKKRVAQENSKYKLASGKINENSSHLSIEFITYINTYSKRILKKIKKITA